MKRIVAISAVAVSIALTGCGEKEKVYAVDMVQTAQADALAASQPPEKVVFDDDGAALFPGTVTQRTAAQKPMDATSSTATATASDTAAAQ